MAAQSARPEYSCSAVRAWSAIAATPSPSPMRPVSRNVSVRSSTPMRNFIVTGTPAGAAAATHERTMARSSARFTGSAAPPPRRVTFGAGQPKLRSTWSTRPSPTSRRTASPSTAGSVP